MDQSEMVENCPNGPSARTTIRFRSQSLGDHKMGEFVSLDPQLRALSAMGDTIIRDSTEAGFYEVGENLKMKFVANTGLFFYRRNGLKRGQQVKLQQSIAHNFHMN